MLKLIAKWLNGSGLKKNDGFTLIEVISSFAVLAIVSVVLLQMFVISTKTNHSAFDMDKANALCIEMSEIFKANPINNEIKSSGTFEPSTSALGVSYIRYYSQDWANHSKTQEAESAFKLEILELPGSTTTTANGYHPEFAWEGTLDSSSDFYLEVSSIGNNCYVDLEGIEDSAAASALITYTQGTSTTSGTAVIPIQLKCGNVTIISPATITINVKNVANLTSNEESVRAIADVYLCDVPTTAAIVINATEGVVSYSTIDSGNNNSSLYAAEVTVTRLRDSLKMAENSIGKYIVIDD